MEPIKPRLAPSLLSADFTALGRALDQCAEAETGYVHVDVMDGHFVPNLTIGPPVVKDLRRHTDLFLDVHLMVTQPENFIPDFIAAGADGLTFHYEASDEPEKLIQHIRREGKQAGMSIKPGTPVQVLEQFIPRLDLILLMSVEPGFGGQTFLPGSLERIRNVHAMIQKAGRSGKTLLEVDGGITTGNAGDIIAAGARILVAGSAVFGQADPVAAMKQFHSILNKRQ
ncbi:MAG: ribulose-phosphate 3-epimerase [Fidelibacterota bacterium]